MAGTSLKEKKVDNRVKFPVIVNGVTEYRYIDEIEVSEGITLGELVIMVKELNNILVKGQVKLLQKKIEKDKSCGGLM